MDERCHSCDENLPSDGRQIKCCECEYAYHLGNCSGWSESTFKSKGEAGRKSWRCPACRNSKSRAGGKGSTDPELVSFLADITQKLDALAALPSQVAEIKQSIEMMSKKYDEILSKQAHHDKEIGSLKKRVLELETKPCDSDDIQQVKTSLNDIEWRSRKYNIEVHGIAVSEDENLLNKLNWVGAPIGLPELVADDIEAIHRLPSKVGKIPGIIVRFARLSLRDKWLEARKALKKAKSPVLITENMTKHNRDLLRFTREWAMENRYRFSWHANGKVFVRRSEGEHAIVIRCQDDLFQLLDN